MSETDHARARQLIAQHRVEGISTGDEAWLYGHLQECEACAVLHQQTQAALSAFRGVNIDLPKNLAARTQLRVRLRAAELPVKDGSRLLLWSIAGVSWVLGLASAPLVWRGFEWAGGQLGLPKIIWQFGVAMWWLLPGIVATGAILLQKWSRTDVTE